MTPDQVFAKWFEENYPSGLTLSGQFKGPGPFRKDDLWKAFEVGRKLREYPKLDFTEVLGDGLMAGEYMVRPVQRRGRTVYEATRVGYTLDLFKTKELAIEECQKDFEDRIRWHTT